MECEQAERARSVVRQGDILAAHPGTANWSDRWGRFYVVLSADCDIVNRKLDTGLVVVPIVGLETFALDVWLPEQLRRQLGASERRIEAQLRQFSGWAVSAATIVSMELEELERQLEERIGDDKALSKAAKAIRMARESAGTLTALQAQLSDGPFELGDLVRRLCEAKTKLTGVAVEPEKELKSALATVADPKRNDLWPICDLVGLDGQMREDERDGFVAVLRRFTQIPLDNVFVDKSEWLTKPSGYFRICRLRGAYKTDFLHRFATMFTRVGLDAGRDDEHLRMFELAAARLLKSKEIK